MSEEIKYSDSPRLSDSIPNSPEENPDDILIAQTKKGELLQEKDALDEKRADLLRSIERLSISLSHYKRQQLQFETKQKLEYYLHQSNHEFVRLSRPDEAAAFVLSNLNVLPTNDVNLRLKLISKFYPNISLTQDSVSTIYDDGNLLTIMNFTLAGAALPSLTIKLCIIDDTVDQVDLIDYDVATPVFAKISQTFCETLEQNYCRLKKIDLIIYSYHSLATLQQERIKCLSQILQDYSKFVTRPTQLEVPSSALASLDHIELTVPENSSRGTCKIRLYWQMVLSNTATGELNSQLVFIVHKDGLGPLKDSNDVFLSLALEHGILKAFSLMLYNLFDL